VVISGFVQAAFVVTGEGVVLVDAPPALDGKIQAAIASVNDKHVTRFIYTHSHLDHVGAVTKFPGARRIAHEEAARLLANHDDLARPLPDRRSPRRLPVHRRPPPTCPNRTRPTQPGNGRTGCVGRGSSGTAVRRFTMQITIIGAGNMARGIAIRVLTGGHTVRIIDRAPDKAARLAAGLQETPQPPTSRRPAQPASAEPASSFSPCPTRQPGRPRRSTRPRCPARRSSTSPIRSTSQAK